VGELDDIIVRRRAGRAVGGEFAVRFATSGTVGGASGVLAGGTAWVD